MSPIASTKTNFFAESVIREMSRLASSHKAVNLAQGLPDFSAPAELKIAACKAIEDDINQYPITWGDKLFRQAIAIKTAQYLNIQPDPEKNITVTCGATEAMIATMLATINPGDEVIVFEPYYENYGPDIILTGAIPKYVSLHPPHWNFDKKELEQAFNNRTKAIIICTPNNPTGKVFSKEELQFIADLCIKYGVMAFTDEIYEHILYDGAEHIAIASIPGMEDLTVTINSLSKTYCVTGWRVGYIIASTEITNAIRKVHDFLTIGAPAPLQRAGVTALQLGQGYYTELATKYSDMRQTLMNILDNADIKYTKPEGAYYIFADVSNFGFDSDMGFTEFLIKEIGVAVVPGSGFYQKKELGRKYVRFCFARKQETLVEAGKRLLNLKIKA